MDRWQHHELRSGAEWAAVAGIEAFAPICNLFYLGIRIFWTYIKCSLIIYIYGIVPTDL